MRLTCDFIELDAESVALLLAEPTWKGDSSVKVELSLPTEVTKAISGRQTRRNFARFARYSIEYALDTFDAEESSDLREWVKRLKGETVAVPLWADGVQIEFNHVAGLTFFGTTGDLPVRSGSQWVVLHEDVESYEIVTVSSINSNAITIASPSTLPWPPGTMFYPLLFGRLEKRPKWKADSDEMLNGAVKVKENSTFARRLAPFSGVIPTVGSRVPDFASYKLWDVYPDFANMLDTTEADILYAQLGFGRQEQQQVYQQPPRRALEYGYALETREEITKIERLFVDRRGTTKVFMKPTFLGDLRLFADLPRPGNPQLIPVEYSRFSDPDYAEHPGAPYIAIIDAADPNAIAVRPHKVLTVDLAGLHTEQDVLSVYARETTLISHLILGCFAEPKITWSYTSDGRAATTIKVVEQTSEYVTPNPDPLEKAYLYTITEEIPGAFQTFRFTSYETPIVWTGFGTYQPGPFSHGSISGDLQLADKVDLSSFDFEGNPLRHLLDFTNEGPITLQIDEVSVDNPNDGSAEEIFAGEALGLDTTGKEWKASFQFAADLDEEFGFYIQQICNVPLFSPKCGLLRANFQSTGTIESIAGLTIVVSGPATVGTMNHPIHYFSIGELRTGAGAAFESRAIKESVLSTVGSISKQTLTLNKPLFKAVVGQAASIFPGCDGTIDTCINVFNNRINQRGQPFVPIKNPSANIAQLQADSGGKKG